MIFRNLKLEKNFVIKKGKRILMQNVLSNFYLYKKFYLFKLSHIFLIKGYTFKKGAVLVIGVSEPSISTNV